MASVKGYSANDSDPDLAADNDKNMETTPGGRMGQKLMTSWGRDDSSFGDAAMQACSRNGKKMGGGKDNIAHSLTGASVVASVKGIKGGNFTGE